MRCAPMQCNPIRSADYRNYSVAPGRSLVLAAAVSDTHSLIAVDSVEKRIHSDLRRSDQILSYCRLICRRAIRIRPFIEMQSGLAWTRNKYIYIYIYPSVRHDVNTTANNNRPIIGACKLNILSFRRDSSSDIYIHFCACKCRTVHNYARRVRAPFRAGRSGTTTAKVHPTSGVESRSKTLTNRIIMQRNEHRYKIFATATTIKCFDKVPVMHS